MAVTQLDPAAQDEPPHDAHGVSAYCDPIIRHLMFQAPMQDVVAV